MFRKGLIALTIAGVLGLAVLPAHAQEQLFFGSDDDVAFAERLWRELADARLVGAKAVTSRPYEGVEPHGVILTTLQSTLTIDGHDGAFGEHFLEHGKRFFVLGPVELRRDHGAVGEVEIHVRHGEAPAPGFPPPGSRAR